jgi:hypothetical protein
VSGRSLADCRFDAERLGSFNPLNRLMQSCRKGLQRGRVCGPWILWCAPSTSGGERSRPAASLSSCPR